MADQLSARIEDQFGGRIRACQRLHDFGMGLVRDWPGRRSMETTADALILALFSRSLDTFAAALELVSKGYGAQAAMLNRSLFEDMVDAHWAATDPETARERYEDHNEHARMVLADTVGRHSEQYPGVQLPAFDADERTRLDKLYGKYGHKSWTGIDLHTRVELIDHHWTNEDARYWLRFYRDFAHRENNQTLHVSSTSLNATVKMGDDGNLIFLVGPRINDLLDRAVFGAFWTLDQTAGLIVDHYGIEISDKTRAHLFSARDFITLTPEQMRDKGRNDPCPCGSNLKFKRCHGAW